MANPLTTALQIGIEQGRIQEQIANNKPRDTGNPLNDMTGIGGGKPLPKPTPPPKEMQLPIPGVDWRKFLVELMINPEMIAGDPSFTVGGSKGSSRNKKILSSGDANAPNAKEFMDKLKLGPAMFPIKKADAQGLTDVLSPHQNPRSGSLKDSGLSDEEKIQLLIRGAAAYKA